MNGLGVLLGGGGPFLGPDGQPNGSMSVADFADQTAADAFADGDPYNKVGLFSDVSARAWKKTLPADWALLRTSLICITLRSNRFGRGKHSRLCLQCHPGKGCPRRSSFGGFVSVLGICACRPPSQVRAMLSLRARDHRVGAGLDQSDLIATHWQLLENRRFSAGIC